MADRESLFDLVRTALPGQNGSDLSRAIAVSAVAHGRQVDKSGQAYILHPMRVMIQCRPYGHEAQIVAALHDVVEDTWLTLEDLRRLEFTESIVAAVDAISFRKGRETYFDYIRRCASNPLAARVKLADLTDNSDPLRRYGGADFDALLEKYEQARQILEQHLASGS